MDHTAALRRQVPGAGVASVAPARNPTSHRGISSEEWRSDSMTSSICESTWNIAKLFRFTDLKHNTSFDIRVSSEENLQVVRITRGVTWLRSHVRALDGHNRLIGAFRQNVLSVGGAFAVLDPEDREVCRLTGS